ncbi:hypothetical protein [Spongiimicrobium sp. 3-5]|uniref:hypothetical protein n=1 Tax=Spongiimicrobium sp. 3-5 TaxID=3332596 RepID=UPI00398165AF
MTIKLKRIKSFTLSEMIVVLLITTVVVGLAFAVLNLVQKQMDGISANYNKTMEVDRFRQLLWIDFNRFDLVVFNHTTNHLSFTNALETKVYEFYDDKVVKDLDTFRIGLSDKVFYFDNTLRPYGEVDALNLTTTKEYGGQQLFVYKKNAATAYMNK